MKSLSLLTAAFSLLLVSAGLAQTTPPVPTPDITPPDLVWSSPGQNTIYNTQVIPILGQSTDTASTGSVSASGVQRVEYKLAGQPWKKLTLVRPGENTSVFFGTFKLNKGKSIRFSLRSYDRTGNESITYSMVVRRSRTTRQFQVN